MALNTPADRVKAYIQLRDFKKAAEDEFKESLKRTVSAMDKLESQLLLDLNTLGANSLSCDEGTVYLNIQTSATVENREEFLGHVKANDLWEAMDVKANKTFVKEYMQETGNTLPGLKVTQIAQVGVRRS